MDPESRLCKRAFFKNKYYNNYIDIRTVYAAPIKSHVIIFMVKIFRLICLSIDIEWIDWNF